MAHDPELQLGGRLVRALRDMLPGALLERAPSCRVDGPGRPGR
jgi:hypothetical protein